MRLWASCVVVTGEGVVYMLYVHVCSCQAIWYVRGVFTVLVTIAFEGAFAYLVRFSAIIVYMCEYCRIQCSVPKGVRIIDVPLYLVNAV